MNFVKTVCVIVDGYSTGKNLAPAFKGKGYPSIHIKSSKDLPSKFKFNEQDYILALTYDNNVDEILEQLKCYDIKLCIPGYESGVELADLLSEKLGLPNNESQYSKARRDKYIMTEMVANGNLKTVCHYQSNKLEAILQWAKGLNSLPIVLKPLDSANGDGVCFCFDEQQIIEGFNKIIATKNQLSL